MTAVRTVTWGTIGATIPVLLALGALMWQAGALAEIPPANEARLTDHEARLRSLEADRATIAELRADVGWIRTQMEQRP
ncbi:MAG: hypothetical protein ABIL09_19650 [Gemmatimonadota bacterium]